MIYLTIAAVETVHAAAEPVTTTAPLLSSEHVYNLLVYAIGGSLGALGLLLGLDKVIIMLFRKGDGDAIQKYSSESVARILPIVIEGITVILVVLTIIILGILRIITAEGTLGILGSVVGYVLGKGNRKLPSAKSEASNG
ncbi:hypothetical protein [Prosthecobacter sp.]|uniref:hypothetical protein n=1 Tax=Prosthecobacter sp. TaxID=1965333 RepID=UPI0037847185